MSYKARKRIATFKSVFPVTATTIASNSARITLLESKIAADEAGERECTESGRWVIGTLIAATILLLSLVLFGLQHFK